MTVVGFLQLTYVALTCALIVADVVVIRNGRSLSACRRENRRAKAKHRMQIPAIDVEEAVEVLTQTHEEAKFVRRGTWFWKAAMIFFAVTWTRQLALPAFMDVPKETTDVAGVMFLAFVVGAPTILALSVFLWAFPSDKPSKKKDPHRPAEAVHRKSSATVSG